MNTFFQSPRLLYRPYCMGDIGDLVRLRNEPSYRAWFYFLPPTDQAAAEAEIRRSIRTWSRPADILRDACTLAVVRRDTGELIGSAGLSKFHGSEQLECVEIGFEIGEAHQGNGYATEAADAAAVWGLERLRAAGARPVITGKAEHENRASRRVLEKAGFLFVRAETYCSVYQRTE